MRAEIKKIQEMMETADYVTDPAIAMSVHLAMTLKKPLLIEGHAGVGKTEIAKVMARMLGTSILAMTLAISVLPTPACPSMRSGFLRVMARCTDMAMAGSVT